MTERQRLLFIEAMDLLARKLAEDEGSLGVAFPYVTNRSGAWRTMPASLSAGYSGSKWSHGNWFCGFWIGLLVTAYQHTGDTWFLRRAKERMQLVADRANDPNTHDIGFIFESSAIPLFRITHEKEFAAYAVSAAKRLLARLVTTPRGSFISSWGPLSDERGRRSSAIDTMVNLPLLYWASRETGEQDFLRAAEAHALMTQRAFIRPDGWTYHAVEYDLETGERQRGYTFQGYGDESRWTRGQAWAIYGFAETARATGKRAYLTQAEVLFDSYLRILDDTRVPFWDADDPAIPNAERDSSAAAVVASACLNMSSLSGDAQSRSRLTLEGLGMLESLCDRFLARESGHRGLLKCGCYSKPHKDGAVSAVLFGDYFFVEAITRILYPNSLAADEPVMSFAD
jgi:unsaturated chondroitin disaccharide hydrolase